ncbi:hypothetical protein BaRGS_00036235 [Batillaria attramentaria]|uniref:Cilia- and flagella-associated protein HOATZ n=1 Tax=Batillaria attramentaria TaxID=370345 RepID=A0ABD0JCA4_9CAEN
MALKTVDLTQQPERAVFTGCTQEEVNYAKTFWQSIQLLPPMESRLVSSDIKQRLRKAPPSRSMSESLEPKADTSYNCHTLAFTVADHSCEIGDPFWGETPVTPVNMSWFGGFERKDTTGMLKEKTEVPKTAVPPRTYFMDEAQAKGPIKALKGLGSLIKGFYGDGGGPNTSNTTEAIEFGGEDLCRGRGLLRTWGDQLQPTKQGDTAGTESGGDQSMRKDPKADSNVLLVESQVDQNTKKKRLIISPRRPYSRSVSRVGRSGPETSQAPKKESLANAKENTAKNSPAKLEAPTHKKKPLKGPSLVNRKGPKSSAKGSLPTVEESMPDVKGLLKPPGSTQALPDGACVPASNEGHALVAEGCVMPCVLDPEESKALTAQLASYSRIHKMQERQQALRKAASMNTLAMEKV